MKTHSLIEDGLLCAGMIVCFVCAYFIVVFLYALIAPEVRPMEFGRAVRMEGYR